MMGRAAMSLDLQASQQACDPPLQTIQQTVLLHTCAICECSLGPRIAVATRLPFVPLHSDCSAVICLFAAGLYLFQFASLFGLQAVSSGLQAISGRAPRDPVAAATVADAVRIVDNYIKVSCTRRTVGWSV